MTGAAELRVSDYHLTIGRLRLPCDVLDAPAPQLVSLGAKDAELAMVSLLYTDEVIRRSGLGDELDRVEDRRLHSIEVAEEALRWLGIPAGRGWAKPSRGRLEFLSSPMVPRPALHER